MTDKQALRKLYKSVRSGFNAHEKALAEKRIFTSFINSSLYKKSKTVLIYVSAKGEPDTLDIIEYALNDGKKIAVPFCHADKMDFHYIESINELSAGSFGIPEPDPQKCAAVKDFSDAVCCVVPGLSFDVKGNRLGYGGGYYDRFLSQKSVVTVGLCFERCLCRCLPSEDHDIKIVYFLTENGLRNSKKEVST